MSRIAEVYRRTRKPKDLLWNRFVARPLAAVVLGPREHTRITPNQVTLGTLIVFLASMLTIALVPTWGGLLAGVGVLEFAYVLDCVDGQLARLRGLFTPIGEQPDDILAAARVRRRHRDGAPARHRGLRRRLRRTGGAARSFAQARRRGAGQPDRPLSELHCLCGAREPHRSDPARLPAGERRPRGAVAARHHLEARPECQMKAIIVAAGRGRRLGPETAEIPKCMVSVGGKPILHRQLEAMRAAGATEFVVVRGYLGERIRAPGFALRFVENPER